MKCVVIHIIILHKITCSQTVGIIYLRPYAYRLHESTVCARRKSAAALLCQSCVIFLTVGGDIAHAHKSPPLHIKNK